MGRDHSLKATRAIIPTTACVHPQLLQLKGVETNVCNVGSVAGTQRGPHELSVRPHLSAEHSSCKYTGLLVQLQDGTK